MLILYNRAQRMESKKIMALRKDRYSHLPALGI